MARTRATRTTRAAPPAKVDVSVEVPQNTSIRVADLTNLSDQEINDLLERAKTAKVRFVILNAPFKVRQFEPVS
jgi:hypothetical protein